jgi:DNA-binding MurR/RpiR family transcriptional regulator
MSSDRYKMTRALKKEDEQSIYRNDVKKAIVLQDLKARLAKRQIVLKGSLRRIGVFAFTHPDEIAFSTGRSLARAVNTSPATVTRFVQALGLRKFSEFRLLFQAELVDRRRPKRVRTGNQ